jgi:hypothetical protein
MPNNKIKTGAGFLDFPLYDLPDVDVTSFQVHGEGNKKVMVIVNESKHESKLEFVKTVLAPLGVEEQDAFIILLTSDSKLSFAELGRNYDFDHLILLGVKAVQIGLQIQTTLYLPIKLNKKELVFTDAVDIFLEEKEKGGARPKAKQLWVTLKSFLGA